jgi:hypothetical protein
MQAMAAEGMPIGSILKHPFVMAIGGSQSGKTSLATVLSLLRMAMGYSVAYASVDDDIPQVRWSEVTGDPDGYVEAMAAVADTLSNANKGQLVGRAWMFDEILRSAQEYGADITKLLIPCLTKGAKGGGLVVVVTHAKTCSAHNLKTGFAEAWDRDRVAIEAIRAMDEFGEYYPTGKYKVNIPGEAPQDWQWPSWMTAQGCPVAWMLDQFPELRGRPKSKQHPQPSAQTCEPLPDLQPRYRGRMESLFSPPISTLDTPKEALLSYLKKRGDQGATARQIQQAKLPALAGISAERIRNYLDELEAMGKAQEHDGNYVATR